jgi:hypothetical protein
MCHVVSGQRDPSLRSYSRFSRQESLFFYQVSPQLYHYQSHYFFFFVVTGIEHIWLKYTMHNYNSFYLHVCETSSVLKEIIKLGCFEKKLALRIFVCKRQSGRLARVNRSRGAQTYGIRKTRIGLHTNISCVNRKGNSYVRDLGLDEKIILKWIWKKYGWKVWIGFMCLRMGFCDGLLWTQYWTFRFLHSGNVMTARATIGFSKSTMLIGTNCDSWCVSM